MNLKYLKPVTPSSRGTVLVKKDTTKSTPIKEKRKGKIGTGGRNHSGKITVYHRGGGNKKIYRQVDFLKSSSQLLVEGIEYDPNRSALLARLFSVEKKSHHYVVAPLNMKEGHIYNNTKGIKLGTRLSLKDTPLGSKIHCIGTCFRQKKGVYQRAAGTFGQLIQKSQKLCSVRLSSGKVAQLPEKTFAILGQVSNNNEKYINLGKAGRNRWLGIRPTTRGVAMNPVDHPHGGGEGKSSGGRPSVTPWARPAHGKKTRKKR